MNHGQEESLSSGAKLPHNLVPSHRMPGDTGNNQPGTLDFLETALPSREQTIT